MVIDFALPFGILEGFVFGNDVAEASTPGDPSTGRNASVLGTTVQCLMEPLLVPLVGGGDG